MVLNICVFFKDPLLECIIQAYSPASENATSLERNLSRLTVTAFQFSFIFRLNKNYSINTQIKKSTINHNNLDTSFNSFCVLCLQSLA